MRFWTLFKERHSIECLFSKLKQFRRIAIRHEKKAIIHSYMPPFSLALWLSRNVNRT